MNDSIDDEYIVQFDNAINTSNQIDSYYDELKYIEYSEGRNCEEYKKVLNKIKCALDYEKQKLNDIFIDPSVLVLFLKYVKERDCKRLSSKFVNEYNLAELIFYAETNDTYDRIIDYFDVDISRDKYIKNEIIKNGNKVKFKSVYYLMLSKMYIKLIDEYLKDCKDLKMRNYLINMKYKSLETCNELENWYFGFEPSNDALLVESDFLLADSFNMNIDNFEIIKNNHLFSMVKRMIDLALKKSGKSEENKMYYEINILTILLNMEIFTLSDTYLFFQKIMEYSKGKYDENSVNFVDSLFSKCPELIKKFTYVPNKKEM